MSATRTITLKLTISYDGGAFSGWQSQPDRNAVQDHLESAFARILGTRVVVHGAGRTDAGVHALGQCASTGVPVQILPVAKWRAALNGNLPPAIRVIRCIRAPATFHARFSAVGKQYRYRIVNEPVFPPSEIGHAWHVPWDLDESAMQYFINGIRGQHDFRAFSANRGHPVGDTKRVLSRASLRMSGTRLTIHMAGNGFLYKMVRILVGTIVGCGRGRTDPANALSWLQRPDTPHPVVVAPACGLTLARVLYSSRTVQGHSRPE